MAGTRRSGEFKIPDLPPRKRQRTNQQRPLIPRYPYNSFKGLPLELREEIYRCLLNDLVAEPPHAYSIHPSSARFQAYTTLRLVDRATAAEAKRVFEKEGYLDRIVLYFDEVPSLYDTYSRLVQSSIFPHVQFLLRARNDENLADEAVREDTEEFIGHQPGFEEDWLDWPGFYGERSSAPPDDHPERSSFRFEQHTACKSVEECIPCQAIVFPTLQNYLEICSHRWKIRSENTRPPWRHVDIGIVAMHGKLKDIYWEGYSVRIARRTLAYYLATEAPPRVAEKYRGLYPLSPKELRLHTDGKETHTWRALKPDPEIQDWFRRRLTNHCGNYDTAKFSPFGVLIGPDSRSVLLASAYD